MEGEEGSQLPWLVLTVKDSDLVRFCETLIFFKETIGTCEICGSTAHNVAGVVEVEMTEQANDMYLLILCEHSPERSLGKDIYLLILFSSLLTAREAYKNKKSALREAYKNKKASDEEFKAAVAAAKKAFPSWRNTPITKRQHVMLKFQELLRRDMDKLALNITAEQGKTLKDAQGDVFRGLEVVEHACGTATLQTGEYFSNVSRGIDTFSIREPLGVCAGICPFNFPAMIPLWMFPVAVTCGNTFILKPSTKDPGKLYLLSVPKLLKLMLELNLMQTLVQSLANR